MNVKVKICGVTLPSQAREIAALGADYIGCIIEFSKSPRSASRVRAKEMKLEISKFRHVEIVGVVVNMPIHRLTSLIEETGIRVWQLHGNETPEDVVRIKELGVEAWKAVTRENYAQYAAVVDILVVDAMNPLHGAGGSGRNSDWEFAHELVEAGYAVVLAGGLTPENVRDGISLVRSSIVDTSSGVEVRPGVKDLSKVSQFIASARKNI
ncbi:MAG: phosphoribosylanthranilate isomerase [bacterium]